MIRLLALTESLDPSTGWGSYSHELAEALRKQEVQVEILSTQEYDMHTLRLPGVHAGLASWATAFVRLKMTHRFKAFDLVHAFVEPYAKLLRAFPLPNVVTVHGSFVDPNAHGPQWARLAFRDALEHSQAVVAVSQFTRDRLPLPYQQKAHVIHNGVNPLIEAEPFQLPKRIAEKQGPLVLSVGALKPRKGFDDLIRGFAQFLQQYPTSRLVIVGDDADVATRAALNALIQALRIERSVHMTGRVSRAELLGWYRACDVFALTPNSERGGFEGFGIVYLEAGIFGKPCVGSLNSGALEAIDKEVMGVLVDAQDPQAIAKGLKEALHLDPERIRQQTRKKTWEKRAQEYEGIYSSILSKRTL